MPHTLDNTQEKLKVSDKDVQNPITFTDVMSSMTHGLILTKTEMAKQTQVHVEQGRLGSLTIVNESGKGGNPLRQRSGKKRRRRSELGKSELKAKLEEELKDVPQEKLKQLLDKAMSGQEIQLDDFPSDELKKLVKDVLAKLGHDTDEHVDEEDDDGEQGEVVSISATRPSLKSATTHHAQASPSAAQQAVAQPAMTIPLTAPLHLT